MDDSRKASHPERFEKALRKLIAIPKSELNRMLAEEKAEKQKKRKAH